MDFAILHGIQNTLGHPALDAIFPIFTFLGEFGAVWIVIGLCMLASQRYRYWGITLLASLLAVTLLNELALKFLIARPRPFMVDPSIQLLIPAPIGYSFPSGHTGTAFAAATVLAFSPIPRGGKIAAWVVALLLAFSRLYLFAHFPTDVLAGAVLGALYGFIAVKVAKRIAKGKL